MPVLLLISWTAIFCFLLQMHRRQRSLGRASGAVLEPCRHLRHKLFMRDGGSAPARSRVPSPVHEGITVDVFDQLRRTLAAVRRRVFERAANIANTQSLPGQAHG